MSEAIADIADWCEMKENDKDTKTEEEDRINAIVERANWAAMAQLCDAVKKGEDVVSLSLHVTEYYASRGAIVKQTHSPRVI